MCDKYKHLSPEGLDGWGNWQKVESWDYDNLKEFIKEHPLCKKYVDKVKDDFQISHDSELKFLGEVNRIKRKILIKPNSFIEETKTLIHELIHIIYAIPGSIYNNFFRKLEDLVKDETERIFNENKDLVLYMQKQFELTKN